MIKGRSKYFIVFILLLLVSVISVTYSYFNISVEENNVTNIDMTTGYIDVNLTESNININYFEPIYDSTLKTKAFKKEFSISNDSEFSGCVKLDLFITNISQELLDSTLKWKIIRDDAIEYNGSFENIIDSRINLDSLFLDANETRNYTLYIWLSYSSLVDQIDMLGKGLTAKVEVEAKTVNGNVNCNVKLPENSLYMKIINSETSYPDNVSSPFVTNENGIDFSKKSSDTNGKGLYYTETNTEASTRVYYYRGNVTNNNVIFDGNCFTILRTNENGSIKLMYAGMPSNNSCSPSLDSGFSILGYTSALNNINDLLYRKSIAITRNYTWYLDLSNLAIKKIVDTPYCNDMSNLTINGNYTYYGAANRVLNENNPIYKCTDEKDINSVKNEAITKPVALITIDEVIYAGGSYNENNLDYFLKRNRAYYTMSPWCENRTNYYIGLIGYNGEISSAAVSSSSSVFPVISIKGDSIVSNGNGSYSSPYIINLE